MSEETEAVVFTDERTVAVRPVPLADPGPGEVTVRTRLSGVSPGTELLLYRDEVPAGTDATLPALSGELSYPTRYGYAAVGEVVRAGPGADDWLGRRVFAFHPHQRRFTTDADALVALPDDLADATAAMLPTAETAVTFLLDGEPAVGERVAVFGCGVVGLVTTLALADFPLASLVAVEPEPDRRDRARAIGADRAVTPEAAPDAFADGDPSGADLAYELSGQPAALNDAIQTVGYDGRVIVGSWYGEKRATLDLGGRFHRDRIGVEPSQVSTLAPARRGRWTTDRRLSTALDRLRRLDLDRFVTDRVPVADAPDAYRRIDGADRTLQVLFEYD